MVAEERKYQGHFVIDVVPTSEAPPEIAKGWVGLVLPYTGQEYCGLSVLSDSDVPVMFGYLVPQDVAIEALRQKSPDKAAWWEAQGFPKKDKSFCFDTSPLVGSLPRTLAGEFFKKTF